MAFTFLNKNLINTTSMIALTSGDGTVSNLYDRKEKTKWTSSGENTDGNTATVSIVFDSPTAISNIILINHNFAAFMVSYNSASSSFTPDLSVTGYTFSNTYLSVGTTTVNSIEVHAWNTHTPNQEKFLGEIIVSIGPIVTLDTNPDYNGYQPLRRNIGLTRELLDGGTVNLRNSEKFSAQISLNYINTQTFLDLNTLWSNNRPSIFVPFPVTLTASFEGTAKEVILDGDLNIGQFRQNRLTGSYRGSLVIKETPS